MTSLPQSFLSEHGATLHLAQGCRGSKNGNLLDLAEGSGGIRHLGVDGERSTTSPPQVKSASSLTAASSLCLWVKGCAQPTEGFVLGLFN